MKKRLFESKLSGGDHSGESSSESEEVAYAKKKSHCNEFASYFENNSSSSKIEVFTLGNSNSSDEPSVNGVRPVAEVLVNVPEDDDFQLLAEAKDLKSKNIHGSRGR